MQTSKWREPIFALLFVLLAGLLIGALSLAFRPLRADYGAVWGPYLAEPEDSLDVIYLGSSFAYCDFNPSLVYDASGLTGYVMAGGEQPLSITYWYLKQIFRTQSPSAVVLEGTSLYFKQYQNYTQPNVVQMPFSQNKLGAIFTAAEPELRVGLLFDLYFYHSRWQEIGWSDVKKAVSPVSEVSGGSDPISPRYPVFQEYFLRLSPSAVVLEGVGETAYVQDRQVSPEDYAANLEWLGKILALCRDNSTQPIVVFNPSYTRCTPEAYARNKADILELDPETLVYDRSQVISDRYDLHYMGEDGVHRFLRWRNALFSCWD